MTSTEPQELRFLRSALTEENPFQSTDEAISWLSATGTATKFRVELIPFSELDEWLFQEGTGNLVHRSGKFFRVEGLRASADLGPVSTWEQPIIDQPEIGILGIIAREFEGQLLFLMQAKMEPGNPLGVQLAPTVQATRSNYTQVHQGARPRYVEYFLERHRARVLIDQLQCEQASAFLRKRNRNIVVEAMEEVPVEEGYRWLTLGQIKKLLTIPNLVGMETRTVISCLPLARAVSRSGGRTHAPSSATPALTPTLSQRERGVEGSPTLSQRERGLERSLHGFAAEVLASMGEGGEALHSDDMVLSWLTDLKCRHRLDLQRAPLSSIQGWHKSDYDIAHDEGRYFRVLAVAVEAGSREVDRWKQPLVGSVEKGLHAFLAKKIHGVLHFLVQGKLEPGNPDTIAVGPSVQCALGYEQLRDPSSRPSFAELTFHPPPGTLRYACTQSEEGGRFYRVENECRIVELGPGEEPALADNYLWVSLRQLQDLLRYGLLNIEARSLLSCLSFTGK